MPPRGGFWFEIMVAREERGVIALELTELEVVEARCNSLRVRSACLDMLSEKLTSGDALPLEVFGERFEVLLTACTRGSQKENATN